jgi:hypothetical protein
LWQIAFADTAALLPILSSHPIALTLMLAHACRGMALPLGM